MTAPERRLKSCVQCGAILQASDGQCPACRAPQPEPGTPRPPPAGPASGAGSPALFPVLGAVAALLVVAVTAAVALRALRDRGAGGAGAGAGATLDAGSLVLAAREADGDADAFDRVAREGALAVELDLRREQETYAIEGASTAEIFAAIEARGPDGPDGKAVGLTRMQSGEYRYARDERSGRCVVTAIGATLTITQPRLTTRTLPEPIYERWQDYVRAVGEHEQRHADIYCEAAGRVAQRLGSQQPFADRAAMEAGFAAAWREEMDRAERENREFHRREAQATALEREIVSNEIRRVERELAALGASLQARLGRPGDRRPASRGSEEDAADIARYDALLNERADLVERSLWLH